MFKDYPHKNKILKNQPNTIIKSLADKSVLEKEFYILKFLENLSFVPRVSNFDGKVFLEEKLSGREMIKDDLSEDSIKELALILRKIHLLDILPSIKKYIYNDFLIDGKYQPVSIMRAILKEVPPQIIDKHEDVLCEIARNIESKLKNKNYQVSLIHGDLSLHNIFFQKDDIFLIDWTDCRLDISSCDVSQLFYLLDLSHVQQKIFLKQYDMDYIDDEILIFHRLLLLLHDLAHSAIKGEMLDEDYITKLSLECKIFYER